MDESVRRAAGPGAIAPQVATLRGDGRRRRILGAVLIAAVVASAAIGWALLTGEVRPVDRLDTVVEPSSTSMSLSTASATATATSSPSMPLVNGRWPDPVRETVPMIVAVDSLSNDVITISGPEERKLNVRASLAEGTSARVAGPIAVAGLQAYFTMWVGLPAVPAIWVAPIAGGVSKPFRDNAFSPAMSSDGSRIAFATADPKTELVVRSLTTGKEIRLPILGLLDMRWSPDSSRLALTIGGGADGTFVRLIRVDSDGFGSVSPLSDRALGSPAWIDNGSIIAADADGGATHAPPMVVDVATMRVEALVDLPPFMSLDISRTSGRLLGLVGTPGGTGVLMFSADAGKFATMRPRLLSASWVA